MKIFTPLPEFFMNPKELLALLTSELAELLELAEDPNASLANRLTPEVIEKIEQLDKQVKTLKEEAIEALQKDDLDIQQLKKERLESSDLSPRDRRLLERVQQVENHAHHVQQSLSKTIENAKPDKSRSKRHKDKKDRRKLFKPLGEDKNWIPL